jgi:hypothetical protein
MNDDPDNVVGRDTMPLKRRRRSNVKPVDLRKVTMRLDTIIDSLEKLPRLPRPH